MKKIIGLILLLVIAVFIYKKNFKKKITTLSISSIKTTLSDYKVDQSAQIEKCTSQSHCVYIYAAPWCPVCHEYLKQFTWTKNKLAKRNIGMILVIGADENRYKEVAMKEQYGNDAVLDTITGEFRKKNGIDSFPYLIVTDPNNKVIAIGQSAQDFINKYISN